MLSAIKDKLTSLLQLILVIIYIVFEEIIWEGVAKPIYEAIHGLKILQKIETKLQDANPSVILVIFTFLLVVVEAAGIYAGVLFVGGQVALGLVLYISKIPIAAFTFWLFRVTEDKLMQFGWFKWLYDRLIRGIEWLKTRQMYLGMVKRLAAVKEGIKKNFKIFKEKYFSKESPFIAQIKSLYSTLKVFLKK